jgi:hypothetical protein
MEQLREMLISMAMIRTPSALIVLTPILGLREIFRLPSMQHTREKVRRRSTHLTNFKVALSIRGEAW